jgi:hypothetical protein
LLKCYSSRKQVYYTTMLLVTTNTTSISKRSLSLNCVTKIPLIFYWPMPCFFHFASSTRKIYQNCIIINLAL